MTTPETIAVAEVLALLKHWRPADAAVAQSASRILTSVGSATVLDLKRSKASVLATTYRYRVTRNTGRWAGDRELLATLENYPEVYLLSAQASVGSKWVILWFDEGLRGIVGCITGTRKILTADRASF